MTAYIDSRLLAATRPHKIRNDVRADAPVAAGVLALVSVLVAVATGSARIGLIFAALTLVAVVIQLPLLLWTGLDLHPAALEVHGLGRREIAWQQIRLLTAEKSWGGVRVVAWTARGERILLRAPTISPWGTGRRRFAQDYRAIERYWLTYRDQYWPSAGTRRDSQG